MADSSDEFESDLSCESEYESVENSDEWEPITDSLNLIGSTANCTLNLPLMKHIFFAGNSKLKITRSVKTISQPKRERCSLLVMSSCHVILGTHPPLPKLWNSNLGSELKIAFQQTFTLTKTSIEINFF